MKKILMLVCSFFIIFGLTACDGNKEVDPMTVEHTGVIDQHGNLLNHEGYINSEYWSNWISKHPNNISNYSNLTIPFTPFVDINLISVSFKYVIFSSSSLNERFTIGLNLSSTPTPINPIKKNSEPFKYEADGINQVSIKIEEVSNEFSYMNIFLSSGSRFQIYNLQIQVKI